MRLIGEKPNVFSEDILGRESIADGLEAVIQAGKKSIVLSIDAGWGKGKTTFINMWINRLSEAKTYEVLHFNAWENDDSGDPLLALICEFEEQLKGESEKKYIDKIKTCGRMLFKASLSTMLKIVTNNTINASDLGIGEANSKHLVDGAGKLGEVELFQAQKKTKREFKKALQEYQEHKNKKIIIFIDELDRCRPTFAIETLETIKHLFNIDNFIFILALDKSQLSCSVQTLYGKEIDSIGYLRRFIDVDFILPEANRTIYTDFLFEKYSMTGENIKIFKDYLKLYIEEYDLSLRDLDKLFYHLSLVLPMTPLMNETKYTHIYLEMFSVVYALLSIVKIKEHKGYQRLLKKEMLYGGELKTLRGDMSRTNYNEIMNPFVALVSELASNSKEFNYDKLEVGKGNFGEVISVISLLDTEKKNIVFLKQLEFSDNFRSG
ncbi:KAP family P-loop NTPase fold protein [Azotosporobacter soli]|uniref:KAP family P-loop NTPase fold protein n=1 Tax=Azotosporobacter soli TaxID=3055040 RepID=UPI0031FF20D5